MIASLVALTCAVLAGPVDPALADRYFQEARWLSDDDGGALWGKPIFGPMLFVDPATRETVSNEAAPGLAKIGNIWLGKLPAEVPVANTAVPWQGRKWTMVMWPLPTNRAERARLMAHESFHRIQDDLGLPAASPQNAHMDQEAGRVWIQLEAKALAAALTGSTNNRWAAIKDALVFRAKRQSLFPGAKAEEDALELNEGLAEYTGYMCRGGWEPETRLWLGNQMLGFGGKDGYSRSFAYRTGPAYAYMINLKDVGDHDKSTWRKGLKAGDSLAGLMAKMLEFTPDPAEAETRAKAYDYDTIKSTEATREKTRVIKAAAYTKALVDGPVLILPTPKGNVSFDPYKVFPFGGRGTVYEGCVVKDDWGTLEVETAALVAKDWSSARVPAPSDAGQREGPGWKLTLNPGWKLVPGPRKGDLTVAKG